MRLSREKLEQLLSDCRLDARRENLVTKCPKCGYNEFGISLAENHLFGCYRKKKCGFTGNIFTLLHYLGKYEEYVTRGEIYSVSNVNTIEKKIRNSVNKEIEITDSPNLSLPVGWKPTQSHPYLDERGFTVADYQKYNPGVTKLLSKFQNYIIFPIVENKEIKGYVARHIWSKTKIDNWNKSKEKGLQIQRYRNSSEADFSKLVLGIDELSEQTETLIIVEGIFDKKNIDNLLELDSCLDTKCVGTFKCHVSPTQLHKILQKAPFLKLFILLYDNDVLKEILDTGFLLSKILPLEIGYNEDLESDAGDMTLDQLTEVFEKHLYKVEDLALKKIKKRRLE